MTAADDAAWGLLERTVLRVTRYAERQRRKHEEAREQARILEAVSAVCPDLTVKHGPFRGLRYPTAESVGSTLFPKLIGSYEMEVHPVLERICDTRYTEIVDIGCAEGYYAVGLARRIPSAKVFAYDTDSRAIELCRKMAEFNGVGDRLVTRLRCDEKALRQFQFSGKGLVLSDCEGCEKRLFSPEVARALAHHDLLVEVHDFIDIEISSLLRQRFEATHAITVVRSVDDITKAHSYAFGELDGYDLASRRLLLRERRLAIMEWYFMTPRTV